MDVSKFSSMMSFSTFQRVLFPGIVIAVGMHHWFVRFFNYLTAYVPYGIAVRVPFPFDLLIDALVCGFVIYFLSEPIYMLLEGYNTRLLPIRRTKRLQKKIERLLERDGELDKEIKQLERDGEQLDSHTLSLLRHKYKRRQLLWNYLNQFPRDEKTGQPCSSLPTRLGNLLASYETYPQNRYGFDGVYFWYHAWLSLDADGRKAIDDSAAPADAMVYCHFAALFTASIHALYLLAFGVTLALEKLQWIHDVSRSYPLLWKVSLLPLQAIVILTGWTFLAFLFWRLSLWCHRSHGQLIRTMFDLTFGELLTSLKKPTEQEKTEMEAVTSYLADPQLPEVSKEKGEDQQGRERGHDR
jgi:uncharacterized protein YdcH (DUF465 family)